MPDLGDVVPLTVEVRDANGALAAAGAITLTIGLPDGTSTSPSPTNPSLGRYQYDYPTVQVGRHTVRWLATGANASAYADAFNVWPSPTNAIVSLTDVKLYLGKSPSDTSDDEELREFIEATTALIEDIRGETVVRRTIVEDIDVLPGTFAVLLTKLPVVSLTSVASVDGTTTWNVADLSVSNSGIVTVRRGSRLWGFIRVTYVAGLSAVPANYALAAKVIIGHLWETQRQPGLGPRPFGVEAEALAPSGRGYAIPNRAIELLGRRGPLVA